MLFSSHRWLYILFNWLIILLRYLYIQLHFSFIFNFFGNNYVFLNFNIFQNIFILNTLLRKIWIEQQNRILLINIINKIFLFLFFLLNEAERRLERREVITLYNRRLLLYINLLESLFCKLDWGARSIKESSFSSFSIARLTLSLISLVS
jgi:hypothetical protein